LVERDLIDHADCGKPLLNSIVERLEGSRRTVVIIEAVVSAQDGRRLQIRSMVDSHQQAVVYDVVLRKEDGVLDDYVHQNLLHVSSHFELLIVLQQVIVLQGNCGVHLLI